MWLSRPGFGPISFEHCPGVLDKQTTSLKKKKQNRASPLGNKQATELQTRQTRTRTYF